MNLKNATFIQMSITCEIEDNLENFRHVYHNYLVNGLTDIHILQLRCDDASFQTKELHRNRPVIEEVEERPEDYRHTKMIYEIIITVLQTDTPLRFYRTS